jgi:fructosamine-3-kinase
LSIWQDIAEQISAHTGRSFAPDAPSGLSGGCINSAFKLSDGSQTWFVKTNAADRLDMFEAEAAGLDALGGAAAIGVPNALCTGRSEGLSFIVMQYLELGRPGNDGWREAGRQLALLHQESGQAFGWVRNNTIGATPQPNRWEDDWTRFWQEQRLGFQLRLAASNGYGGRLQSLGEQLLTRFPALIDHSPVPSLLHGDLWGGNLGFTRDGRPVIYDPATYFGDREAEIAMTELFGGFSTDFYAAYNEAWPLNAGYRIRRELYNLYHVLNHLNLFGGGYASQAQGMMQRLLAEC